MNHANCCRLTHDTEFDHIKGMTEAEAAAHLFGLEVRVQCEDGRPIGGLCDSRHNRVNLALLNGRVFLAQRG